MSDRMSQHPAGWRLVFRMPPIKIVRVITRLNVGGLAQHAALLTARMACRSGSWISPGISHAENQQPGQNGQTWSIRHPRLEIEV